jgi:starch synthase
MAPVRILFLSAEVKPFAKVGGLGDVAGSLPVALRSLGHDVRIVTPAYRATETALRQGRGPVARDPIHVSLGGGTLEAGVLTDKLPGSDVPVYFLARRELYDRERVYGYEDDVARFVFLCRAAFDLLASVGWLPQIVHAHDWHTAAAVSWLASAADPVFGGIPTVYTIHNLAHQGRTDRGVLDALGIRDDKVPEELPGEVNLMARGIRDATTVSTVSPTYAREILEPMDGAGLDRVFARRGDAPAGIVNGLDYDEWDPARDSCQPARYDARTLGARAENRRALCAELGLAPGAGPLVGMVSRLDPQKGIDLLPPIMERLAAGPEGAALVLLGGGLPEHTGGLKRICERYPGRLAGRFDVFDNELAHRIYGACDVFVMPSLFEPCGIAQLIAMRYGCVPVVRATGGLVDTVEPGRTGFRFTAFSASAFWGALEDALEVWRRGPERWRRMQRAGMSADWSWARSALSYVELYGRTLAACSTGTAIP